MDHVNESILNDEIKEHLKQNRTNHMQYLPDMEVIDSDILDKVVADMQSYDYDSYTAQDVQAALSHDHITPEDFRALLSPAALPFLEQIAQRAQAETRKHFGNSIYMFTPIKLLHLLRLQLPQQNKTRPAQLRRNRQGNGGYRQIGLAGNFDFNGGKPQKIDC